MCENEECPIRMPLPQADEYRCQPRTVWQQVTRRFLVESRDPSGHHLVPSPEKSAQGRASGNQRTGVAYIGHDIARGRYIAVRWFHAWVQLVPGLHGDLSPESFRIAVHVMSAGVRPGYQHIDYACGGGHDIHRPTSAVASNPRRSHPLNVAGFSPLIPDTAPAIVFHRISQMPATYSVAASPHMVIAFRRWRT